MIQFSSAMQGQSRMLSLTWLAFCFVRLRLRVFYTIGTGHYRSSYMEEDIAITTVRPPSQHPPPPPKFFSPQCIAHIIHKHALLFCCSCRCQRAISLYAPGFTTALVFNSDDDLANEEVASLLVVRVAMVMRSAPKEGLVLKGRGVS